MRIVCPSCQATYEVPEKLLGATPRKVRCARCGGTWMPEPEASPPAAAPAAAATATPHDPPAPPEPEPEPDLPPPPAVLAEPPPPVVPRPEQKLAPPPVSRPGHGLVVLAALAWAASLALLAGAGWAAIAWHREIMALWAPSRRIFALLGLA